MPYSHTFPSKDPLPSSNKLSTASLMDQLLSNLRIIIIRDICCKYLSASGYLVCGCTESITECSTLFRNQTPLPPSNPLPRPDIVPSLELHVATINHSLVHHHHQHHIINHQIPLSNGPNQHVKIQP